MTAARPQIPFLWKPLGCWLLASPLGPLLLGAVGQLVTCWASLGLVLHTRSMGHEAHKLPSPQRNFVFHISGGFSSPPARGSSAQVDCGTSSRVMRLESGWQGTLLTQQLKYR